MGDIVDELEAEGSELSLRAARYIRIKRRTEADLRQDRRTAWGKVGAAPETSYAAIREAMSGEHQ